MEEDKQKAKKENIEDSETNPLLMIEPRVTGTPLGLLPIAPIPSLDINDYHKTTEKNDKNK